jgi:hypothetical protein
MWFQNQNSFSRALKTVLLFLFVFINNSVEAQVIEIKCRNTPLNQILVSLRDRYGIMSSFDDKQLSNYVLTVDKKFASAPQVFDYLLKGLPLAYDISDDVFIIYPAEVIVKSRKYNIAGRITDKENNESLPFSNILINRSGLISDAMGNFSFTSTSDSVFSITVSYLGYYILDTVLPAGTGYSIKLTPSVVALKEIIVKGSVISHAINVGNLPGTSRLNHKVAYFLPGNGDNSIFNLLRLQPGILAAGEQSADLIIRGSYEGQSQVIFDGFTLFGMKNFNDNISAINPFMAKDIKIMKGTFGAEYGERVGGIVDITGADGDPLKPLVQLCINNMTLNGKLSIPLFKKSALLLAYRQTYYNLYRAEEVVSNTGSGRGRQSGQADYYAYPHYIFRDMNIKYSGSGKNSNYFISLYGGLDDFSYSMSQESQYNKLSVSFSEANKQLGASAFYGINWKKVNRSNFIVSYSALQSDKQQHEYAEKSRFNPWSYQLNKQLFSLINEINARTDNRFTINESNISEAGTGALYYFTQKDESELHDSLIADEVSLALPYLYFQHHLTLWKKLKISPGVRADYHTVSRKIFLQPRISIVFSINKYLKFNASWGLYNQFAVKNMVIDSSGNYRYLWSLCENKRVPVLNAGSAVAGITFNHKGIAASIEGYMRQTDGMKRYLQESGKINAYNVVSKTKGIDFFIKTECKQQTFWASYTLSKTIERFSFFTDSKYRPSLYDQRHELKLAGLLKIKSFHISAAFVYGSGLPDPATIMSDVQYTSPYTRLDAAVVYRILKRKIHLDMGISVLNVMNKENVRFLNYSRIPVDEVNYTSLYAEAVPFTPSLFLNLYFH